MTEELNDFIEIDYKATAGAPLEKNAKHATKEEIITAIKSVQDPELMLNIYDLGLIYEINDYHHKLNITVPDGESYTRNIVIRDHNGRLKIVLANEQP